MADSTTNAPATATPPGAAGSVVTAAVDQITINAFESLNKWKDCILPPDQEKKKEKIPARMVYQHNRSKAGSKGFPSVLEVGRTRGLTDHEISALFGWTTGDYRFVNPIARGTDDDDESGGNDESEEVQFTDYPLLPQDMSKLTFRLTKQDVLSYIEILKVALSKLSTTEGSIQQQKIWRGHKRPLPSDVGNRFVLKGFTSATLDRENALDFCIKTDGGNIHSKNKKRTLLCVMESKSGVSISKFSARPEEMEILFPPDTTFEVVEYQQQQESAEEDQKAVQGAMEKLQKEVPEATIGLLYVKEVY